MTNFEEAVKKAVEVANKYSEGIRLAEAGTYRDIQNSGGCNECGKRMTCEYAPKLGQLVRYNCPFYEREAKEWE